MCVSVSVGVGGGGGCGCDPVWLFGFGRPQVAFQSLGKLLACCVPPAPRSVIRTLALPVTATVGIAFTAAVVLLLVLPSFFTLLVVRTAYIEVESTAMEGRQFILLAESCARRWVPT